MPSRRSSNVFQLTKSQQRAVWSFAAVVILALIAVIFPKQAATPGIPPTDLVPATNTPLALGVTPQSDLPTWLKIYFTNPNPPDDINNGIDRFILPILDGANKTIDVVSFDVNLPSVVNALVKAHLRGVKVRVIYDGKQGDAEVDNDFVGQFNGVETLDKANVSMVDGGRSNGLMHNKFIIVDGKILIMGSWNISYNDTFRNNNNVLVITAPQLIANYQAKFNEGFEQKRFGAKAEVGAQTSSMVIEGVQVENYFSPVDEVMQKLVGYIQGAKKSVHFYAFTYTHADLATAMIESAKAGVDVQGIIENRGASQGALVPLYCAKLPVKTDGNKYTMHHKVIVIDSSIVVTGSFNFTKSADTANDDNVLVIHSSAVATLYEQEYQRLLAIANLPNPAEITCQK